MSSELSYSSNTKFAINIFLVLVIIGSIKTADGFFESFGESLGSLGDQVTGYVDNLYKNLDNWAEHVINHAKGEECQFFCPNAKKPSPNLTYKHEPTGCGTFGIKVKDADLPMKSMRKCCDDHQICYHKCAANKTECDDIFGKCLSKQCKKTDTDDKQIKGCETASKMLFMGILTFGCKTYKDAQKLVCICNNEEL